MMVLFQAPSKMERWEKSYLCGVMRTFKSKSPGSKLRMLAFFWGFVHIIWGYKK